MNGKTIIMSGIVLIALILPTMTTDFLTLPTPNAFGQQVVPNTINKGGDSFASNTASNKSITDYNLVTASTVIGTNDNNTVPIASMNQTIPKISVLDMINSTYIAASNELDEDESDRRIIRAIRDRINDILHTVVMSNATIISTISITNSFVNSSTTINNQTRLLEAISDQVEAALAGIRAKAQAASPSIEIHTDIDAVCKADDTALADCNMNIRIH